MTKVKFNSICTLPGAVHLNALSYFFWEKASKQVAKPAFYNMQDKKLDSSQIMSIWAGSKDATQMKLVGEE